MRHTHKGHIIIFVYISLSYTSYFYCSTALAGIFSEGEGILFVVFVVK